MKTKSCLNKSHCHKNKKIPLLLRCGSQQDMLHMFNWIFLWMAHFDAFGIKGNMVFSFRRRQEQGWIKEIKGHDLFTTSCQDFQPVRWYLERDFWGQESCCSLPSSGECSTQNSISRGAICESAQLLFLAQLRWVLYTEFHFQRCWLCHPSCCSLWAPWVSMPCSPMPSHVEFHFLSQLP